MSAYGGDLPPPPTPLDSKAPCLSELPPVQLVTLEHRTKFRPKPKKRTKPSRAPREVARGAAPPEAEQNSIMGKLDEGLEDFFSKKVVKLSFKLPGVKAPSPTAQESSDKKRESRKSGFFNLIKSRTSRSEKSHGAAAAIAPPQPPPPQPAAPPPSSSVSPVSEEPAPPSPPPRNPEPQTELHRAPSSDRADPETEAPPPAAEAAAEEKEAEEVEGEEEEEEESGEKKENPHIPRHMGVPMMGMDLLAEMKARQERMAGKKSEPPPVPDRADADKPAPDVPADADESKPEPAPRSKPPSVTPKPPPPQAAKPPLGPRASGPLSPTGPLSPSSSFNTDDSCEAPAAGTKGPLPAPRLKRAPSEQESESDAAGLPPPPLPPQDVERVDIDAFEPPSAAPELGGRQWSSLKSSVGSVGSAAVKGDERERTKSLPAYVNPPSLSDADARPPPADLSPEDGSEESDDAPSV